MGKFCSNCGNKIDENADVCIKCGIFVNDFKKFKKSNGKGLGIASMVVGIIGVYYAVIMGLVCLGLIISDEILYEERFLVFTLINFWPIALGSTGLGLSISAIKKNKFKMTTAGLILNIITLSVCLISFLLFMLV